MHCKDDFFHMQHNNRHNYLVQCALHGQYHFPRNPIHSFERNESNHLHDNNKEKQIFVKYYFMLIEAQLRQEGSHDLT